MMTSLQNLSSRPRVFHAQCCRILFRRVDPDVLSVPAGSLESSPTGGDARYMYVWQLPKAGDLLRLLYNVGQELRGTHCAAPVIEREYVNLRIIRFSCAHVGIS